MCVCVTNLILMSITQDAHQSSVPVPVGGATNMSTDARRANAVSIVPSTPLAIRNSTELFIQTKCDMKSNGPGGREEFECLLRSYVNSCPGCFVVNFYSSLQYGAQICMSLFLSSA